MTDEREWLVADGLGGFGCGCADGIRRRRQHGVLVAASPQTERRFMLVNGFDAWIEIGSRTIPIARQRYSPGVLHPDNSARITSFVSEPWPTWQYDIGDGMQLVHEQMSTRGRAGAFMTWRVISASDITVKLGVRLLMSGRDLDALHRENGVFRFEPARRGDAVWEWTPYDGVPSIFVHASADYQHDPVWYRDFVYELDAVGGVEDLASPGILTWTLGRGKEAELLVSVPESWTGYSAPGDLAPIVRAVRESERARIAAYRARLHHSADAYVVRRGERETIINAYPVIRSNAREALAAVRGICLHPLRLDEAEQVLEDWSGPVVRHACGSATDKELGFGSETLGVDGPLWFIVAVQEFLTSAGRRGHYLDEGVPRRLTDACEEVLQAYARGAREDAKLDSDGLLASGAAGSYRAPTWMNAIVDGRPLTPRVGKPVEIQALWINALTIGARWSERWGDLGEAATRTFATRFWNAARGCLFDIVDVDHVAGTVDARVRPNQLLAVGGLPAMVLTGQQARSMVEVCERLLWTPLGMRSLAPDEPEYVGHAEGDAHRVTHAAYHGAAWPWLLGPFVEAWVRVHAAERASGSDRVPLAVLRALRVVARKQFLRGIARHLDERGIGHVAEMADGDEPQTSRGAPFHALSLAEVGRVMMEE